MKDTLQRGVRSADETCHSISEVARATMSLPELFRPVTFFDGVVYSGVSPKWNNPSKIALSEAKRIWPTKPIVCLVSIWSLVWKHREADAWFEKYCNNAAFAAESTHFELQRVLEEGINYFRLRLDNFESHKNVEWHGHLEFQKIDAHEYKNTSEMLSQMKAIAPLLTSYEGYCPRVHCLF